jgi:hypothetical protein
MAPEKEATKADQTAQGLVLDSAAVTGMKMAAAKEVKSEMAMALSSDQASELDSAYSMGSDSEQMKDALTAQGSVIHSEGCSVQSLGSATERGSEVHSEEAKAAALDLSRVLLTEEASEVGWDWVKASSSAQRSEMGSEEALV